MADKISCSVQILTCNSEENLEKNLISTKDFEEVIILDGNSTDKTLEIAKKYNCKIYPQIEGVNGKIQINDFSYIRNRGIKFSTKDWIVVVDSDEYLTDSLIVEIRDIVSHDISEYLIYKFPRKYEADGKIIDYSIGYPNYGIRLWNKKTGLIFRRKLHEKPSFSDNYKVGITKNLVINIWPSLQKIEKKYKRYLDIETKAIFENGLTLRVYLKMFFYRLRETLHSLMRLIRWFFYRGNKLPLRNELFRIWYRFIIIFTTFPYLFKDKQKK
ncbi:MAG: glycosyltransferase family 2 protein [bacterium]